jgi:hypothetical protein
VWDNYSSHVGRSSTREWRTIRPNWAIKRWKWYWSIETQSVDRRIEGIEFGIARINNESSHSSRWRPETALGTKVGWGLLVTITVIRFEWIIWT